MAWQAKKSFGQHALHDKAVAKRLVEALPVGTGERVVEVGPGEGALTRHVFDLFEGSEVTLIEADHDLFEDLKERFEAADLIEGDAALVDYGQFSEPWHFLSNLPYNASAAILKQVFVTQKNLQSAVIIAQKEQAQRMLAPAGEMSMLSLSTQLYASGKKVFDIAPGSFNPPPNVDSRAILLTPKVRHGDEEAILEFARPAFHERRKQLKKTLSDAHGLEAVLLAEKLLEIGLTAQARPQELSIEQWRDLYQKTRK